MSPEAGGRFFGRTGLALLAAAVVSLPPLLGTRWRGESRSHRESVASPALAGAALGDDSVRFRVVLPNGYRDDAATGYPVVYFLPGFDTSLREYLEGTFQGLDLGVLPDEGAQPFILVAVDGDTGLGGTFFADSPVYGDWPTALAEDLVAAVDARYATIRHPWARVIAGHSMGGYGALSVGLARPDVFGSIFALSPGALPETGLASMGVFEDTERGRSVIEVAQSQLDESGRVDLDGLRVASPLLRMGDAAQYWGAFVLAYGAAFAAEATDEGVRIALPARIVDGVWTVQPDGWRRFENGFGGWEVRAASYQQVGAASCGVSIEAGSKETWIREGSMHVASVLREAGLPVRAHVFEGGHNDRVRSRIELGLLPFATEMWTAAGACRSRADDVQEAHGRTR